MKNVEKIIVTIVVLLVLGYGIFIYFNQDLFFCPILKYFHFYCPACGVTRMILSILELDFYQAFRFNPLIFILLIILILFSIVQMFMFINKRKFVHINNKVYIGLIIVLIVYTIMRNMECFSFLLPTIVN